MTGTSDRRLGARVAAARRAAAMTQTALAHAVGLDRTALSKIEHGRRSVGSLELARIARALGRPMQSFLAEGAAVGTRPLRELRRRRREIAEIAASHGADAIRVFGSVARGDARPESDVDLLVRMQKGRGLFDQAALLTDLRELLGREVDVVTDEGLRGAIRERVLREAVPL